MFTIISFTSQYRDDSIFCLLTPNNALYHAPKINDDILDIQNITFTRATVLGVP